jgi:acetyl-CoA carboxylase carboxyltransferase component
MDFKKLNDKRIEHSLGGGKEKQEVRRRKGNLTAFERINTLFDSQTFVELDQFVTHECTGFGMEKKNFLEMG